MRDPSFRQSPLATLHLRGRETPPALDATVQLIEKSVIGKLNLRADPTDGALLLTFESLLGYPLPLEPNRTNGEGERRAFWLGPDEWLITVPGGQEHALFEVLSNAVTAHHVALSDVSDARIVLALSGPGAQNVLEKGCGLDLHSRSFQTGHCAQTQLARVAILLHQTNDAPAYDIHVAWSFAAYLWAWFEDAAAEFGLTIGDEDI